MQNPDVVRNNLYKQTALLSSFGVNMVALVGQQPRLLNLYEVLNEFVEHRVEVITRRTFVFLERNQKQERIF